MLRANTGSVLGCRGHRKSFLAIVFPSSRSMEPKQFHRRLETLLDRASGPGGVKGFAERLMPSLLEDLGPPCGFSFAQLHRLRDHHLSLVKNWGAGWDAAKEMAYVFAAA